MDENVFVGLVLDESIAFAGVEPLHCSLFFRFYYLALSYFALLVLAGAPRAARHGASVASSPYKQTGCRVEPCSPVERNKMNHKSNKRKCILSKTGIHCLDGKY